MLIEDIFLYNMIIWDLCWREPIISKTPFFLIGVVMPQATLSTFHSSNSNHGNVEYYLMMMYAVMLYAFKCFYICIIFYS